MLNAELTAVVAAYRRYEQLPVLIHSFLCQTLQNFRLLVIHDGTDDRMETLLEDYRRRFPDRIDFVFTPERHNDYGHSLRELGIGLADTPFLLITNDDNYYVPRFLEFMFAAIHQRKLDVVLCNMIHSHENPGRRKQKSYNLFVTKPRKLEMDMGSFIVRTSYAKKVGFRDKTHDGDGTFFEDVLACDPPPKVGRVPRVLFVHN
jgi:GT2 family glycosyltransferase